MKKYKTGIIITMAVLVILSLALYPFIARHINANNQSQIVTRYLGEVSNLDEESIREALEAAREYNKALYQSDNRFAITDAEMDAYNRLLDAGRGVMGILTIDKIGVNLPIYHGTNATVLQVGIGHMPGTSLPVGGAGTHAFITGHRGLPSSKLLSNLDEMAEGDTFSLFIFGETLTYRVDHIQTVLPDDVRALDIDSGKDYCTLVTCTPYGVNTHRLLVRGQRTENAESPEWSAVYADAKRLDKILMITMFIIPALPVFIIIACLQGAKIHKRGKMKR